MAGSGTGGAQKLLHFAVTNLPWLHQALTAPCMFPVLQVRRAAVLNLGFVLLNVPEQCPKIVRLLAESYNPHVRSVHSQRSV